MNVPNLITLSRVPLLFLVALVLYLPFWGMDWLALALYVVAALSDWLDGYWARRFNVVSTFGKLMDALTDKILTVGLFVLLLAADITPEWTLAFVLIILAREFFVTGLRLVAVARGTVLAAEKAGKIKTFAQMFAIGFLLFAHALDPTRLADGTLATVHDLAYWIGMTLYSLAAALTAYSGWFYTNKYRYLILDKELPDAQ
ncbi:MAG: CDP-diacylglycerol--glycerol-3-phosphate 3-phosphatidyltransferase [Verrucomicrobiota bacterium]